VYYCKIYIGYMLIYTTTFGDPGDFKISKQTQNHVRKGLRQRSKGLRYQLITRRRRRKATKKTQPLIWCKLDPKDLIPLNSKTKNNFLRGERQEDFNVAKRRPVVLQIRIVQNLNDRIVRTSNFKHHQRNINFLINDKCINWKYK
jgi:hypothetical protein